MSEPDPELAAFELDVHEARHDSRFEARARRLGAVVSDRRDALGLSVEAAAAAAGLPALDWRIVEDGGAEAADDGLLRAVALALDLDGGELDRLLEDGACPSSAQLRTATDLVLGADAVLRSLVEVATDGRVDVEVVVDVAVAIHEAALVLAAVDPTHLDPPGGR